MQERKPWVLTSSSSLLGADLLGADLLGADLLGADLLGADLLGADLLGADLLGADLFGADLLLADLLGAPYDLVVLYIQMFQLWNDNKSRIEPFTSDCTKEIQQAPITFKNTPYFMWPVP